jgi:hypothetical protein
LKNLDRKAVLGERISLLKGSAKLSRLVSDRVVMIDGYEVTLETRGVSWGIWGDVRVEDDGDVVMRVKRGEGDVYEVVETWVVSDITVGLSS